MACSAFLHNPGLHAQRWCPSVAWALHSSHSQGYLQAVPQLKSLVPDVSSLSGGQKTKQRLKPRLSQDLLQGCFPRLAWAG